LRLFAFGGYGLALAALALVVFGAYDSYPIQHISKKLVERLINAGERKQYPQKCS